MPIQLSHKSTQGRAKTPRQARVAYFIFMRHNHAHTHSTITIGLMKSTNNHFTITGTEAQKGENNSSCRCARRRKIYPFFWPKGSAENVAPSQPASKERVGIGNGSPAASYPARTRTIWFLRHKRLCVPARLAKTLAERKELTAIKQGLGKIFPSPCVHAIGCRKCIRSAPLS